ncbi:MAG TPA: hypothetical protein VET48_14865 [Steroidobacteraceae bacterium]|nr:hypothetical protein [Steroidobacteraceae bacterium]
MTNHDQISSFIDNELGHEQEQDFLISLASSEGLRRSFRSELVLKNIIHRDEVLTSPSRDLRPAVLGTIGIVGATLAASETADAATTAAIAKTSVLKTLFATKIGALVTASVVTVSALGGYAVRSVVVPDAQPAKTVLQQHINPITQPAPQTTIDVQTPETSTPADLGSAPAHTALTHSAVHKAVPEQSEVNKPINVVGSNTVTLNPPKSK